MFKKLRNKLLLMNMAIITVVMVAAFASIYIITYANNQSANLNKLYSMGARPFTAFTAAGEVSGAAAMLSGAQHMDAEYVVSYAVPVDYELSFELLTDDNGDVIQVFSLLDMPQDAYVTAASTVFDTMGERGQIELAGREWLFMTSVLDVSAIRASQGQALTPVSATRIAFLDVTETNRQNAQLLITFALVGLAMLAVLFWVSFFFANRSIRPIEENWEKQQRFIADASHELKTPIAIISANADALLANETETVASQTKWINYIQAQAGRMGKLVNSLLYLARAENAHDDPLPFDLSLATADVAASFEALAYEKGVTLNQLIEPGVFIKADEENIRQVAAILLDNAIKYTGCRGAVNVALRRRRGNAALAVSNTGAPIDPCDLMRIFDRFYRADPSRSQETGGYGLGLSIAKTMVERAGGSIWAESEGGQTTFTVTVKTVKLP